MDDQVKDLIMLRAVEHARRSEFDEAITCINQILEEEPYDPLALFNKGFTLRMAGKLDEAAGVFSNLLKDDPTAGVLHQLGMIASSQGERTRALGFFLKATQVQPCNAEFWYEAGTAQYELGLFREARESLLKASVFDPENAAIWDQLGLCYQKEGEFKDSLRSFDRALESEPASEQVFYHKARLLEQMGKRTEEIACYDTLILLQPESIFPWLKKGLALMMDEKYQQSIKYFSVACRLDNPGHMPFLLKGLVHAIIDQHQDAIPCFEEAQQRSPEDTDISLHLARALGTVDRHEDAVVAFDRILAKKPDSLEAEEGKVRSLYHLKKWDELFAICAQNRLRDSKNPVWSLLEVRARGWETGEENQALVLLEESLEIMPEDIQLLLAKVDLLVEMNQKDTAVQVLISASQKLPDTVPLLYRLATLLADQHRYGDALEYLEKVISLRPEDAHLKYLAGQTCEQTRDLEKSLDFYTIALRDKPDDSGIWLARARVLLDLGSSHEALASARQATSLSDDWYEAWIIQGRAEMDCNIPEDARKTFTLATLIRPEDPEGWRYLGDVLMVVKEAKASWTAYDRALALDRSYHDARYGKIGALLFIGEWDLAIEEYDISLSLKGENFWDLHGKAMILMDIDREDEAIQCLEKAGVFAVGDSVEMSILGDAWNMVCEFSKSEHWYDQSLQLDPDNAEVWSRRGHNLKDAGKHQDAVKSFDQALNLDPEDGDSYLSRQDCVKLIEIGDFTPINEMKNRESILKDVP